MSKIVDRISEVIEDKGISNRAFEMSIGASNGMIGRAISKGTDITAEWLSKIINSYPDINAEWLLTGIGKKYLTISIKRSDRRRLPTVKDIKSPYKSEAVPSDGIIFHTDESNRRQQIPIYDTKTLTGLVSLFANSHSQPVLEMFETCQMPKCDGGLRIAGDSMYPLIKSGDVVFYKQVHNVQNNIVWGEMYLLSFDIEEEEYITIKYLQKSEDNDCVSLVSYNEQHKPMDIPISRIRALAYIKAWLRLNSIK